MQTKLNTFTPFIFLFFLFVNFTGLYLGGLFTTKAVMAEWYLNLNKSPITPPGWFFGFAWTTIMVFLAFYMTKAHGTVQNKNKLYVLYGLQWILNLLWNPVFFYVQNITLGLVVILSLTLTVAYILVRYRKSMKWYSLLLAPYFTWLCVASYLNLYILLNN